VYIIPVYSVLNDDTWPIGPNAVVKNKIVTNKCDIRLQINHKQQ